MKKVLTVLASIMVVFTMAVGASANLIVDVENPISPENSASTVYSVDIHSFESIVPVTTNDKAEELIECVLEDRKNIPEDKLNLSGWGFEVRVNLALFSEDNERIDYMRSFYIDSQHHKTIEWVKANGYWEAVKIQDESPIYIVKAPGYLPYMDFWDIAIELSMDELEVMAKIEGDGISALQEYIYSAKNADDFIPGGNYLAYQETETEGVYRFAGAFSASQLENIIK